MWGKPKSHTIGNIYRRPEKEKCELEPKNKDEPWLTGKAHAGVIVSTSCGLLYQIMSSGMHIATDMAT